MKKFEKTWVQLRKRGEEKRRTTGFRLPVTLLAWYADYAAINGVTMAAAVERALAEWAGRPEPGEKGGG